MSTLKTVGVTIIGSLVFLGLLYAIVNVHYTLPALTPEIEPVHVFIALVPFAILLAASGQLKEIRGPGGLGLLLRGEVQRPILEVSEARLEVRPEVVAPKGDQERLRELIAATLPTTLSFEIGKRRYYTQSMIEHYIRELKRYPRFRNVLFVDGGGSFMGFMRLRDYMELLQSGDIVSKIENREILEDPRVVKDTVEIGSTYREALAAMERVASSRLAVVDKHRRFVAVVMQDEIVRRILTNVARAV